MTDNSKHSETEANNNEQTASTAIKKKPFVKLIKWSAISLCVIVILLFTTIISLLNSETLQHKLLALLDQQMEPLQIAEVKGNLQQGLTLSNLSYHADGIAITLPKTQLQLTAQCLWRLTVCINQFSLQQPQITIDTALLPPSEPDDNQSNSGFAMPIGLNLPQIEINQLALKIDNRLITLDHFSTGLQANRSNHFHLLPTQINGLNVIETVENQLLQKLEQLDVTDKPTQEKEVEKPMDWQALKQALNQPLLDKKQTLKLPFSVEIDTISAKNWLYRQQNTKGKRLSEQKLSELVLKANSDDQQFNLAKLYLRSTIADLDGQGQLQWRDHYPLQFTLKGEFHQQKIRNEKGEQHTFPNSHLTVTADGELYARTNINATINGVADASLSSQLELTAAKTPFSLDLAIQQAKYPLFLSKNENPATDQIRLIKTKLNVMGDLLHYQADLQGNVEGMHSPTVDLELNGEGSIGDFRIQSAHLSGLGGSVDLQGYTSWQNEVIWDSRLQLKNLNVYRYFHSVDWLATLSGELASSGKVDAQGWQVDIPVINLTGSANNRPINIQGDLALSNQIPLLSKGFQFDYGQNHLLLKGKLAQDSQFDLTLNAPDFSGLYRGLDLAAQGEIRISGDIQQPELDLNLDIAKLKFDTLLLQNADIKGKIQSDQQNIRGNLALKLAQFKLGDAVQLTQLQLNAKGDEKNHQLNLRSQGKPAALNVDLQGNFDRNAERWQVNLKNGKIDTFIGQFNADKTINIDYLNQKQQATISAHCWNNSSLPLCFPQTFTAGVSGHIPFKLQQADLRFLKPFLGDNTQLNSRFNLDGEVNWYQDKPFDAQLNLDSNSLSLVQKLDYRRFALNLDRILLKSTIKDNNLKLNSDIKIRNNGEISTELTLTDLLDSKKLGGKVQFKALQLALIKQLLNSGDQLDGRINADLSLAGTASSPQLHGRLALTQLTSSMPALPFNIKDGFANLNFNGNRSTMNGEIVTQEGTLRLQGDSSWQMLDHWQANLSAKSDGLSLTIPEIAKLTVVPDIHLHAQPQHLNIEGKIDIPRANIDIEQLPESAITVSNDEVILEQKPKLSADQGLNSFNQKTNAFLSTNINISLGERVLIKAYGLKSRLDGVLNLRQQDNQLGLYGQIKLLNGRFASYGQDLLVRKGEIIFSGLPSQPTLNIEAIRNPTAMENSNITAGIRVSGLAESPTIQVFSEPSMSQDNALSYLLTGRSLSSDGGNSGASLGAALISMSLSKTGKAVGQIGETFGIRNLNLETQGLGDQSQVVVSGYLTPRLQVKYGVGLFEPLAELTLRYRLLPKLYLQSVSGTSQAVDLLYQFER
ncbi:translocation/assembly module TamB domain-containing protein [Gallibacterium anatis]|uniref:autotransporter assembly complex protein TamB n=1 Tax=Gallibacterium anatis TaxID=750 RepID=UPI00254E8E6A|nr:translocation/assembly module TamB domain-containing protein [Gallibacterium anatis]WIM84337.1 translocation/assembly module TamB domain-containing protein [Gallibacterium anatis]